MNFFFFWGGEGGGQREGGGQHFQIGASRGFEVKGFIDHQRT